MINLTFLLLVINHQSCDVFPQLRVIVNIQSVFLILMLNSSEKLPDLLDGLPRGFFYVRPKCLDQELEGYFWVTFHRSKVEVYLATILTFIG